jgi:hypothetical protein
MQLSQPDPVEFFHLGLLWSAEVGDDLGGCSSDWRP